MQKKVTLMKTISRIWVRGGDQMMPAKWISDGNFASGFKEDIPDGPQNRNRSSQEDKIQRILGYRQRQETRQIIEDIKEKCESDKPAVSLFLIEGE
jgi:hypothetical protein